jgi:hypothetical protein
VGFLGSDPVSHHMKLFVMATKESKMHIKKKICKVLTKVTQVSDVAHGPRYN